MVWIYLLELHMGKYYVGKTNDIKTRTKQHFKHLGSTWTKRYKPIRLLYTFRGSKWDEDKFVLEMMYKYGVRNVRGGRYARPTLTPETLWEIHQSFRHANNQCFACGSSTHFVSDCCVDVCYRCARTGHVVADCNRDSHALFGRCYKMSNHCYRCGRYGHWSWRCNRSTDVYGRRLERDMLRHIVSKIF